ncbi:MAG: hypothetical protein DI616_03530 [Paracoccus denitrificans]|uniref:H-type lectin domain-containing protein n=1 Tax=Paracoccus denitrificans TaxID=266 RepID=A0A533IC29_PARDE|nr:MAG: hypothetical protein DI616_03530 [Paracoccus denitrificans]
MNHYAVGILQGSEMLFSDFEAGGLMWTGSGQREHRVPVVFDQPFRDLPVVHIGLTMWDIERGENQRVDLRTETVSRTGFSIIFATWGNTHIARVRADWLAIGPVEYEEDFDL